MRGARLPHESDEVLFDRMAETLSVAVLSDILDGFGYRQVATKTVERAFAKAATEDAARTDLRTGAFLSEVWARYRVL